MTKDEANKLYQKYQQYDEAFRKAKKSGDHRRASEYKAKRDAINLSEIIKVRNS